MLNRDGQAIGTLHAGSRAFLSYFVVPRHMQALLATARQRTTAIVAARRQGGVSRQGFLRPEACPDCRTAPQGVPGSHWVDRPVYKRLRGRPHQLHAAPMGAQPRRRLPLCFGGAGAVFGVLPLGRQRGTLARPSGGAHMREQGVWTLYGRRATASTADVERRGTGEPYRAARGAWDGAMCPLPRGDA